MKWRAYNVGTTRIGELVGAQPVTVQAAELPQALATGVVNAFITSGGTGYDSKVWESLKYFYDVQAWLPKNFTFVNKAAFDALDKPTQEAILKAAATAETRGWKAWETKSNWYLDQLKAKGMTVEPPGPALKAGFEKIGEQLTADWLKKAGDRGPGPGGCLQEDVRRAARRRSSTVHLSSRRCKRRDDERTPRSTEAEIHPDRAA